MNGNAPHGSGVFCLWPSNIIPCSYSKWTISIFGLSTLKIWLDKSHLSQCVEGTLHKLSTWRSRLSRHGSCHWNSCEISSMTQSTPGGKRSSLYITPTEMVQAIIGCCIMGNVWACVCGTWPILRPKHRLGHKFLDFTGVLVLNLLGWVEVWVKDVFCAVRVIFNMFSIQFTISQHFSRVCVRLCVSSVATTFGH